MASIKQDKASGVWRIHFRFGGHQYQKSLETKDEKEAEGWKGRIELTLRDMEMGRKELPPDADLWQFVKSDGKLAQKPTVTKLPTLAELFEAYDKSLAVGAKGTNTLRIEGVHRRHLLRIIGASKALATITATDLQRYINQRANETSRGSPIRRETISKEVKTFLMVWNRAEKLLGVALSKKVFEDLSLPRTKAKQPFRTWAEIEKIIERGKGKLDKKEEKELWESVYLDLRQVSELLEFVEARRKRVPYMYPLMLFAAHTGARLSEILRSREEDLKFDDGIVIIREKKKSQSSDTFRQVPMSPSFKEFFFAYVKDGHHSPYTICNDRGDPIRDTVAHKARKTLFRGSKWTVLRGFHVLRHSFASNLAREEVDQRLIDEMMGHQTVAMQKRYQHLAPELKVNAIKRLFGAEPGDEAAKAVVRQPKASEERRVESAIRPVDPDPVS